jgi:hypothetical protein
MTVESGTPPLGARIVSNGGEKKGAIFEKKGG